MRFGRQGVKSLPPFFVFFCRFGITRRKKHPHFFAVIIQISIEKRNSICYNVTERTETVIFQGGSILAFTDFETEQLRKALLKETRRCAVTLGMKKTSVDQLTRLSVLQKARSINSMNPRKCCSLQFWRVYIPSFTGWLTAH